MRRQPRWRAPSATCLVALAATMLLSPMTSWAASNKQELVAVATVPTSSESSGFAHLTCFHGGGSTLSMDERQDEKKVCCQRFWDLRREICKSVMNDIFLCREDEKDFVSWCTTRVAPIPQVSMEDAVTLETDPQTSGLEPVLSLFMSSDEEKKLHGESFRTGEHDLDWQQFSGDNLSLSSENESFVHSPFSVPSGPQIDSKLQGHLVSELSAEGGMHRSLAHTVTLTFGSQNEAKVPVAGSVLVYVFLSEGVFIDIDDPLDGPCQSSNDSLLCHAEFVSIKHEVIDIEQPSFASPQHVVAIRINVKGKSTLSLPTTVTLRVVTRIHLRYPQLTSGSSHVSVAIPAPFLHRGTFQLGQGRKELVPSASYGKPISFRVAAGIEEDYPWVAAITILSSIVGSLVMLRDFSRVSKWN